jgi:hypothetical protein
VILDQSVGQELRSGYLRSGPAFTTTDAETSFGYALAAPVEADIPAIAVFGHTVDRLSHERGPMNLLPLATYLPADDAADPEVLLARPAAGAVVVPLQGLELEVLFDDDSRVLESLTLIENRSRTLLDLAPGFQAEELRIPYRVPAERDRGALELTLLARDRSGRVSEHGLRYPLAPNEPPLVALTGFHSYLVDGQYLKTHTAPEHLNNGEFWVRSGETFRIDTAQSDDAGLASLSLWRLGVDGTRVQRLAHTEYAASCPSLPQTRDNRRFDIVFDRFEPTEYQLVLVDTYGHEVTRNFLVHPQANVVPEIRITSPAAGQGVVAGTRLIKVGVVAADDRLITQGGASPVGPGGAIEVFANGVPLAALPASSFGDLTAGGGPAIAQGYASIYDAFEHNYDVATAELYGHAGNPYAIETGFYLEVPDGLIRHGEDLTLTAHVYDAEGAVGTHELQFQVAPDLIKPEPAILAPELGFGAVEDSDFTLRFRAYDNVKVSRLDLYMGYGVLPKVGDYARGDMALIRSIDAIPTIDAEPITTLNIDTPVYRQMIHVDRLHQILAEFGGMAVADVQRTDVWIKVVAFDAANSQSREVSWPVGIDERPVIDVLEPLPGATAVEETELYVNVQAFDDVGIEYVRLVAAYANGQEDYEQRLRRAPYNFLVPMPTHDAANPANNRVTLTLEAIDTYGRSHGDLDNHTATETVTVEVVEDQPPVVEIGTPADGDEIIEGQYLPVQVNAVDDVAVDRVVLNVAGLRTGDRSFTDLQFPYEYLIEVPYGQAHRDLTLTATVTEQRHGGEPRSRSTPLPVTVQVGADHQPPVLSMLTPAPSGASVAEKRVLPYRLEVSDNVRVASVQLELFADLDGDGAFSTQEQVASRVLLSGPYAGSQTVATIAEYLGLQDDADTPDSLDMLLRATAFDGIGNLTPVDAPITLVRNSPPEVTAVRVLDSRGFSMGSIDAITEGRAIVVNVQATDAEVGVDSATLYYAIGPADEPPVFQVAGEDSAAPFQFHLDVPRGRVGEVLRFRAKSKDLDGYDSAWFLAPNALTTLSLARRPLPRRSEATARQRAL